MTRLRASRYNLAVDCGNVVMMTNLVTRAMLELERDAYETFCSLADGTAVTGVSAADTERNEFVAALRQGMFLVPDDLDELQYIRLLVQQARHDARELGVVIAPTMGCNFNCHYCFESRTEGRLEPENIQRLLALIASELAGRQRLVVQWFGGEPLLDLPAIRAINGTLQVLCEREWIQFASSAITNGAYLDQAVAEELATLGIGSVQVTLDGERSLHDRTRRDDGPSSFQRALDGMRAAARAGIQARLRVHVAPFSLESVYRLLDELVAEGMTDHVAEIYFTPLFNYSPKRTLGQFQADDRRFFRASDFAEIEVGLYQRAAELGFRMPDILDEPFSVCTAVRSNTMVVGPSGHIYKCYFDLDHADRAVGHVSLGTEPSARHLSWLNHEIARDDECKQCKFLPVCFGGCTKKWFEGASKDTVCTPLRYNAEALMRVVWASGRYGDSV
jgi:uncharacterized protein